jgi:hypothetical protein
MKNNKKKQTFIQSLKILKDFKDNKIVGVQV